MRINYDCMRDILLELEDKPFYDEHLEICSPGEDELIKTLDKYSPQELMYSVRKLVQAGLIKSNVILGYEITNKGHEVLGFIRNDILWEQLRVCAEPYVSCSLDMILDVLKENVKSLIYVNIPPKAGDYYDG